MKLSPSTKGLIAELKDSLRNPIIWALIYIPYGIYLFHLITE
ncbi:hypothetical protein [Escherichia phage ULINTec7]|uniref:Uncharacterized protein n=1 Tax=Escherichia phage ULINTec7 TaxID=2876731 RepID=A0AAE8Y2Y1_9CAUD|nr:hypothetical protein [Escherichia phage ULINTec7]